jgi:putative pyruvate formate lyase activating enzyme
MSKLSHIPPARQELALAGSRQAETMLRECRLCAWDCGVERHVSSTGRCHAPARARVFQQRIEWAGEADLVPTRLLNFSGCNFRCSFCLTGRDSQDARRGAEFDAEQFSSSLRRDEGLYRTITVEGGEASIFLADALQAIAQIPEGIPVVWKTNGFSSEAALEMLQGCIDVFLVDYKFGNDACAKRLAGVDNYLHHLQQNLRWGQQHSRMIVRHLLMPGHVDCCFTPMLHWLQQELPGAELSIMGGFSPVWNSCRHPELLRQITSGERRRVERLVRDSGLRLVPWAIAPTPENYDSATEPADDHLYIGRDGSVRVAFMTAELKAALAGLEKEIPMAVNMI